MSLRKANDENSVFHSLNAQEISNPQLVLEELFDFADKEEWREMLWDWLKTTVTGSFHSEASDRAGIMTMYEMMDKLVEAAHLLKEQGMFQTKTRRHK